MPAVERQIQPSAPETSRNKSARIPLYSINVFEQPRKTFEEIDNLALNIARHDLLHPLIVAQMNPKEAQEYLDAINKVWKTSHTTEELTPSSKDEKGEDTFLILIAGERRLRSFKLLDSTGCLDCQENYGEGSCFTRHFGDEKKVEVKLMTHYNPFDAIEIQFIENTHMRIPADEEALSYDMLYSVRKKEKPSLTISEFARNMGRSPSVISSALRFAKLPDYVQDYVRKGALTYGMAVEVERAREGLNLDETNTQFYVVKALAHRKVEDFRKAISGEIEQRKSQQTMLGLFTQAQEIETRKLAVRRTVGQEIIQAVWGNMGYMDKVRRLVEEGKIGKEQSPYSMKSPLKVLKASVEQINRILPQLEQSLPASEVAQMQTGLKEANDLLSQIIPEMPDQADIFPEQDEALRLIVR